ncbi:MAG: BON domain-containing protein [Candidatus Promineifilaceae bacterium]|nr:BON domain-containing protein [Candidatus Promineifilaceae bacterium]
MSDYDQRHIGPEGREYYYDRYRGRGRTGRNYDEDYGFVYGYERGPISGERLNPRDVGHAPGQPFGRRQPGEGYGRRFEHYGARWERGRPSTGEPDYGRDYEDLDWRRPGPHTGRGPAGYRRSDERIHEDVCERLTHHGAVDASNVEITVEEGVVTLSGTVDRFRTKRMAEDTALSVAGVHDVQNRLRLAE